ncbi:putative C-_U-editing enzyme APOBEC-4, partial [Ophiophagus hannah]
MREINTTVCFAKNDDQNSHSALNNQQLQAHARSQTTSAAWFRIDSGPALGHRPGIEDLWDRSTVHSCQLTEGAHGNCAEPIPTQLLLLPPLLYHTEEDFPMSTWNCEALQSLASMWPQVTLNPLCGGLWHSLLYNFVSSMPQARFYHPILPIRTLADKKNATQIRSITGMKLPFVNTWSQPIYGTSSAAPSLQNYYLSTSNYPAELTSSRLPPKGMPSFHFTPPINTLPPLYKKPRNIVRHTVVGKLACSPAS